MSKGFVVSIWDWIDYNPNVGVEKLLVTGLEGKGKTSLAHSLALECMAKHGESFVMVGDRFCEWRHFALYNKIVDEVIVLIPKDVKITYMGEKLLHMKEKFIAIDYHELKIMDYLKDDGKVRIVVVYDAHLFIDWRVHLWVEITEQLINRVTLVDSCIGLLFNEAGVYFTQESEGEQWKAITAFTKIAVDTRKGYVRCIFVQQLPNEIKSYIRNKCMFKIYKKGKAARDEAKSLRKAVPFTALNQYRLSHGGLFNNNCTIDKFIEEKQKFKMIPFRSSYIYKRGGKPQPQYKKGLSLEFVNNRNRIEAIVRTKDGKLVTRKIVPAEVNED